MAKTKTELLQELEEAAAEVFKTIKPDDVTKADIEKLLAAAPASPDPAPEGPDENNAPATGPADEEDDAAALPPAHWGIKEDDYELVGLAMAGYNLTEKDVLDVKVYSPKKVVIVTVAGKKCEFIDCRK